jgi:hypothetical protein
MLAFRQSEHVYHDSKFSRGNRLHIIRATSARGHVRFSAVRNETAPPKVPWHVRVKGLDVMGATHWRGAPNGFAQCRLL